MVLVWYVIQVINGREDVMRERIERVVPEGAMQELFYPQFQTEIKVHGEWVNTTKPLFPGYLICDTADPRTVQQYLLRMDDFARVLSQDGRFVPLAKEEVQLIGGFTHRGDRVVPIGSCEDRSGYVCCRVPHQPSLHPAYCHGLPMRFAGRAFLCRGRGQPVHCGRHVLRAGRVGPRLGLDRCRPTWSLTATRARPSALTTTWW